MDENKTTQPTPEQLLKLLESEMNASRHRRLKLESKRRTMQVASIMFIVVSAAVAFWVLTSILDDLQSERGHRASSSAERDLTVEMR